MVQDGDKTIVTLKNDETGDYYSLIIDKSDLKTKEELEEEAAKGFLRRRKRNLVINSKEVCGVSSIKAI